VESPARSKPKFSLRATPAGGGGGAGSGVAIDEGSSRAHVGLAIRNHYSSGFLACDTLPGDIKTSLFEERPSSERESGTER
jgi:hypothetical protein